MTTTNLSVWSLPRISSLHKMSSCRKDKTSVSGAEGSVLRMRGLWCRQSRPSGKSHLPSFWGSTGGKQPGRPPPAPPEGGEHSGASVHTWQGSSPVVGRQPPGYCHQEAPHAPAPVHLGQACPSHLSGKRLWAPQTILPFFFIKTFQSSFRFTGKLSRRYRALTHLLAPSHSLSPPAASLM